MSARKEKGITLVALIITIIVMLILVGVSVQVVINSDLIGTAQDAANRTETEYLDESELGSILEIEGKKYLSMEDYVAGIERAPDIMGGYGTEANPYTIDSIEALVQFAHSVTNGKTYEGEYVKLTRNLDFKSVDSYVDSTRTDYSEYGYTGALMTALTTGEGFKPIGREVRNNQDDALYSFAGTFDGNGKIISNLYMNKEYGEEGPNYECGLFGMNYGVIKNLGVELCNISLSSVKCLGVGAIAGRNNGEINSCYASGEISLDSGTGRYGGITGALDSIGIVKDCYNRTKLEVASSNGVNIYMGGITGTPMLGTGSILNCYNSGELSLSGTSTNIYIGGIIGYSKINIKNSYNFGNVVSTATATGTYNTIGGIVGLNHSGTIEKAYFLSSTAAKGAGKNWGTADITSIDSIDDMTTVLSVIGSAFVADTNNINGGYPILSWQ